jgi:hypothetical protein
MASLGTRVVVKGNGMASDDKWRFLTACPNCAEGTGLPVRVSDYTTKLVGVWMRCGLCASEWVVTGDAAAVRSKAAVDRRHRRSA